MGLRSHSPEGCADCERAEDVAKRQLKFTDPYIIRSEGSGVVHIWEFPGAGAGAVFSYEDWTMTVVLTRRKADLTIGDVVRRKATGPRASEPYLWKVAGIHEDQVWLIPRWPSDSTGVVVSVDDVEKA